LMLERIGEIRSSGELVYRGRDAVSLARKHSFEDVLYLLLTGSLPSAEEEEHCRTRMVSFHNSLAEYVASSVISIKPSNCIFRVPVLLEEFSQVHQLSFKKMLLSYVCMLPIIVAAKYSADYSSTRLNHSNFSFTQRLLQMLDIEVDEKGLEYFESVLVLHMEDPDNPSLRVLMDSYKSQGEPLQALKRAIAEHKKPLHHGAGAEALKMIIQFSKESDIEKALLHRLESGRIVYGFGHRVYETVDPRARYIHKLLRDRCEKTSMEWLFETICRIADSAPPLINEIKGAEVHPNVDLYNAAFYHTYGLPAEANTDLFAIARAAGWVAHLLEAQKKTGYSFPG